MYLAREKLSEISNILEKHVGRKKLNDFAHMARLWVEGADEKACFYRKFWIDKQSKERLFKVNLLKSGRKYRPINAPSEELKEVTQNINEVITRSTEGMVWVKGFNKAESVLRNAEFHVINGARCCINIDLKNAFTQITFRNLYVFARAIFKWRKRVALKFARLMTDKNGNMVQGNPLSPVMLNLFALAMDRRILMFCRKYKYAYTRYADDLTISSKRTNDMGLRKRIRSILKIVNGCGFTENKEKVKFYSTQLEITGTYVTRKFIITRRGKLRSDLRALHGLYQRGYTHLERMGKDGNNISIYCVIRGILEWLYPTPLNPKATNTKLLRKFSHGIPRVYSELIESYNEEKKTRKKAKKVKRFTKRELACSSGSIMVLARHRGLRTY